VRGDDAWYVRGPSANRKGNRVPCETPGLSLDTNCSRTKISAIPVSPREGGWSELGVLCRSSKIWSQAVCREPFLNVLWTISMSPMELDGHRGHRNLSVRPIKLSLFFDFPTDQGNLPERNGTDLPATWCSTGMEAISRLRTLQYRLGITSLQPAWEMD
jgi:hypothetical protein